MFSDQPAGQFNAENQEDLTSLIPRLTEAIESALSIKKNSLHHYTVRKAVQALCKTLKISLDEAISILTSPPPYGTQIVNILAEHITIGETYFFRHSEQFEFLEKIWLPSLVSERIRTGEKKIALWSAGCSTGEEPYSLAILLNKVLPDFASWDITILATDINKNSLAFAQQAVYNEWSFRGVSPAVIEKYFVVQKSPLLERTGFLSGSRYKLKDSIRNMVSFRQFDLAAFPWAETQDFPRAFDSIFCRNVLMYFTRDTARQIIGRFHTMLREDGLLAVSPSEGWFARGAGFSLYPETSLSIFKKKPINGMRLPPTGDSASQNKTVIPVASQMPPKTSIAKSVKKAPSAGKPGPVSSTDVTSNIKEKAQALADTGKLSEALALIEAAISADTTHAESHYLKALILMNLNRLPEAESSLKKAIFLDAEMVVAYLALASIAQVKGNHDAMIRHYRTAIKLLAKLDENQIVPYSDGMPAKALATMISKVTEQHEHEEKS